MYRSTVFSVPHEIAHDYLTQVFQKRKNRYEPVISLVLNF